MSKKGGILNRFEKGLSLDSIPERQPEGTYTYALNLVNSSSEHLSTLTNEESNIQFNESDFPGEIVGVSYFSEIDQSVVFVNNGDSELYVVNHSNGEVTFVMRDSEFGCDWNFGGCEMMYGELKLLNPCNDRVVYFSSDCNYWRVNIDEVLSERKNCIEDCDHFRLFRCVCTPKASMLAVDGGGFLEAGAYWVALQLEDNDGNQTNYFPVEGPVFIGSENNIAGEISNQSIRIFVDEIDSDYEKVNITIIKKVRGVVAAQQVISRSHGNTSFTYDYVGDDPDAVPIDLEIVLNKTKKYIRGSDLFQKDGRLWLSGIKQEPNVNYQKFANEIQTRIVEFEVTAETQKEYNLPSLMRDEVYGVVAWINYCDGTKSRAFHVPAGGGGSGGNNIVDDVYTTTIGGQQIELVSSPPNGPAQETIPYVSNFSDWVSSTWFENTGVTPIPNTGPDEGVYYVACGVNNIGKELISTSPFFDFTQSINPKVAFEIYMYGEEISTLQLQVSTNGQEWGTVWEKSGDQGQGWVEYSVNLSAVAGSWAQLRFITVPKGNLGDIALRALSVTNASVSVRASGANQQYSDGTYNTSKSYVTKKGDANDPQDPLADIISSIVDSTGCSENIAKQAIDEYKDFFNVTDVCTDDIEKISDIAQNIAEEEAEFAEDDISPELGLTGSLKEAAKNLYNKAIKNREYRERGKTEWTFNKSSRYSPSKPAGVESFQDLPTRIDNWTTSSGANLLTENPRVVSVYEPGVYESDIPYPDQCDCDGNRMYPEGNIRHHLVPSNCQSPHYISNQIGVPSKEDPVNSAFGDTYIRLLGFEFSNVYIPTDDELPKPVCPNNPITFGILKRDLNDRSVIAKGLLVPTFTGTVRGREHAMGKHGVSSFETVDVAIDNGGSKIGVNSSPNAYLFHSLDTSCQRLPLTVTDLSPELEIFGSGWRYGLYAEGEKPEMPYTGKQIDQRGARQAVTLSGRRCLNADDIGISGITYAPADSVVTPPSGITLPLNNRFRESSVYLQLDSSMPALANGVGPESDSSFVGDVLDHSAPIEKAAGWYVSLKRELRSQYGSVENQKGISTGIRTPSASGGSRVSVMGIAGDTYIGVHSLKRSGYVSDKVGGVFPVSNGSSDGRQSSWKRDRSICDHPADFNIQNLGIDHYATRLPEDGDVNDAKNWAGLHTTDVTYAAQDAAKRTAPDSDYYYPRLQKTLVSYIGEFEVNPWKRATGEGRQKEDGKVYYPALKDLELDSSFSSDIPWTEGWLNRFYVEVEQPSKAQLAKKAFIRTLLSLIAPVFLLLLTTQLEAIPDTVLTTVVIPMITFYISYAKITVFSEEWLNKIVGIPICKNDDAGGETYVRVRGFEDNYCEYYIDFSSVNEFEFALGIPSNYNTCNCSECDAKVTREIYYSNKQVETSIIDSYRNFQANNYSAIPAHAGPVLKLFTESNRFYAHTTDNIWVLQYDNVTAQFEGITSILGKGDLLADPQPVMEGPVEGSLGLSDPNAAISCEAGYVWVSRPSGQIMRINNGKIDVLSARGMYNFFHENLNYCNDSSCIDEREDLYYSLGYDPRFKRLLVTKTDQDYSWTASYHFPTESWVSFHSYIPKFYIWDQKNMYSISNNNIWAHNAQKKFKGDSRTWCNFYGTNYPVILDFVARHESGEPWQYQNTIVDLDVQKPYANDWLRGRHIFFDQMAVWNRTQSTGMVPITVRTDNPDAENDVLNRISQKVEVDANYANDGWRLNNILDRVKNCSGAVTSRLHPCNPRVEILSQADKVLTQENLYDRYLFYRFIANSPQNHKIYIKSVISAIAMQSE